MEMIEIAAFEMERRKGSGTVEQHRSVDRWPFHAEAHSADIPSIRYTTWGALHAPKKGGETP
jgi:hypothetical protein